MPDEFMVRTSSTLRGWYPLGCLLLALSGPVAAQAPAPPPTPVVKADLWPPEVAADGLRVSKTLAMMIVTDSMEGGRVHVETLMSALGALSGFAAQQAIRETVVKPGKLPLHGVGKDFDGGAFVVVSAKDGKQYFFGNLLNSYLAPQPPIPFSPPPSRTLYALVGGGVVAKGGVPLPREEMGALFARTAKAIGTPEFGKPGLDEAHMPHRMPREEVVRLWPKVLAVFQEKPSDGKGQPLDAAYWPVALGVATQMVIPLTVSALPPSTGMRVFFEAAVPMSKIDPSELFPNGVPETKSTASPAPVR